MFLNILQVHHVLRLMQLHLNAILNFIRLRFNAEHFWHLVAQDMRIYHKTQGYPTYSIASQVHEDAIDHISYKSNI